MHGTTARRQRPGLETQQVQERRTMTTETTTTTIMLARRLALALSLFGLAAAFAPGCSSDEGTSHTPPGHDETDMGDGSDPDASTTPPPPPGPAYVVVESTPARVAHAPGAQVTLQATVFDGAGEEMSGAQVNWTVTPADAVEGQAPALTLSAEGIVEVEACAAEPNAAGEPVCQRLPLTVDAGPPELVVETPEGGAMMGGEGAAGTFIEVRGRATDTHGQVSVVVNGQQVELDGQGGFTAQVVPRMGVNAIEVVASDGIHSRTARVRRDVLWAAGWLEPQNPGDLVGFQLDDGLGLRLGQSFFDDDMPYLAHGDGTIEATDLADVLALLLEELDYGAQIPDPVVDTSSLKLRVTNVDLGVPNIDLDLTSQGAELYIQVPAMKLDTAGSLKIEQKSLDLTGTVEARLSALAALTIRKAGPNEPFEVEMAPLRVALETADSAFASAEADAVFELAEGALRRTLEQMAVTALEDAFVSSLPGLLESAFGALDTALRDTSFTLDTGFTEPLEVTLDGRVAQIETTYRGHLDGQMVLAVTTDKAPQQMTSRGIPLFDPWAPDYPFFASPAVQIGVRLELVNGLLHSLWDAGVLTADLKDFIGLQVQALDLQGKLPPVLVPPQAGEPFDLMIELGQLELVADFGNRTDSYGVQARTGVTIDVINNEIVLSVGTEPDLEVWLIETSESSPLLKPDAVRQLILDQVWPQVVGYLTGGLSFAIPVPDISGISQLAPALANLDLVLGLERGTLVREGFALVHAAMKAVLPPGMAVTR